jgi:hypothetical protein
MLQAKDIADPATMAWLLTLAAFVIGLLVHIVRGAKSIFWSSVVITFAFNMLLYVTIYRNAASEDAMWMIGLFMGLILHFTAIIAAGFLVKQVCKHQD